MSHDLYNRHATPVTREQRIAGNSKGVHQPSYRRTQPGVYLCLGCKEPHESPALWCEECCMHTALRP
jgi:hypothetical protein